MPSKVTFQEALERFRDRNDIVLCEDGWNGWNKKSKFYDKVLKKEWWALPRSVFKRKSIPLNRSSVKQITFKIATAKLKDRDDIVLCEDGWNGWTKKSKFYDKVLKKEWWARPEAVFRAKSASVKRRKYKKITFQEALERFKDRNDIVLCEDGWNGWSNKSKFYDKVLKKEWWVIPNDVFCRKTASAERKNGKNSNRFIKETGEHFKSYFDSKPEPKPSIITVSRYFGNVEISLKDLDEFISDFKDNKTSLEILFENLMNVKHFNLKPNLTINYRPDFKLSETVFVNVDGLYWHDELNKGKDYHFNMRKDFEKKNLRLFQFYQNELLDKPEIIKSILCNVLGNIETKIFARKCEIRQVLHKDAVLFLNQNHLMGPIKAKHIGLYYESELVSLMSYKVKNNTLKIERFCSKVNVSVVGGFSKILTHIEKNIDNIAEIHNWVDLRYGTGEHLESKGFVKIKETIGWKWTDYKTTFNRLACRANMDERKMTESQYAKEKKWFKIYDAGQRLWVKIL